MNSLAKKYALLYLISIVIMVLSLILMKLDILSATFAFLVALFKFTLLIGLTFCTTLVFFYHFKKEYKFLSLIIIVSSLIYDLSVFKQFHRDFLYAYFSSVPLCISFVLFELYHFYKAKA